MGYVHGPLVHVSMDLQSWRGLDRLPSIDFRSPKRLALLSLCKTTFLVESRIRRTTTPTARRSHRQQAVKHMHSNLGVVEKCEVVDLQASSRVSVAEL
jgi:hypothetical protein